ncbi:hypothetical protein F5Y14DRAFT_337387 [Nemania sp. NC0429]|nr:hypothetical protein F5Y14DRAFT_337387 [Nemania sp. NC0429]
MARRGSEKILCVRSLRLRCAAQQATLALWSRIGSCNALSGCRGISTDSHVCDHVLLSVVSSMCSDFQEYESQKHRKDNTRIVLATELRSTGMEATYHQREPARKNYEGHDSDSCPSAEWREQRMYRPSLEKHDESVPSTAVRRKHLSAASKESINQLLGAFSRTLDTRSRYRHRCR